MRTILAAQAISVSGSQISVLALPTLAVLFPGAGPLAAAGLFAISYGAEALTAPLAGILVDTVRRHRRLLIAAAIFGCLTGITNIAIASIIPRAAPAEQIVRTNAAVNGAEPPHRSPGPASPAG